MTPRKGQGTQPSQVEEVVEKPRVNGELIQPPSSASAAKNAAELFAYHLSMTEGANAAKLKDNSLWRNPATNTYIFSVRNPIVKGVLTEGTKEYTEEELWALAAAHHYFAEKNSELHNRRVKQWSKYNQSAD